MRYMVMIQATGFSEAGIGPGPEHEEAMAAYRRVLAGAGTLLAVEELVPSAAGLRITYPARGGAPEVEAGPFPADGGLVAAYAVLEAESEEEALRLVLRMPVPAGRGAYRLELRRLEEREESRRGPGTRTMEADLRLALPPAWERDYRKDGSANYLHSKERG